jgi:nucleoside-diphosphate-sugar epimerase
VRILVTGATGFIGARVARALRAEGHRVLGLARSAAAARAQVEQGLEPVRGDLAAPEGLAGLMRDARPDAVAHLAAEIATQRDERLIRRVNVEGTRALAEGCRGLPLRRFVFLSSVVVGQPAGARLDEAQPLVATTAYGRSKLEGEALLRAEQRAHGLPLVVVRPSHVYGAGGWFAEITRDLHRHRFLIPGDGENLWDVVHVDDVVRAVHLVLDAPADRLDGGLFHVVDDTPVTLNGFVARICAELGRRPPWHVPAAVARLVAGRGPVDAAVRSARSSNRLIRERLGWTPRFADSRLGIPPSVRELRDRIGF